LCWFILVARLIDQYTGQHIVSGETICAGMAFLQSLQEGGNHSHPPSDWPRLHNMWASVAQGTSTCLYRLWCSPYHFIHSNWMPTLQCMTCLGWLP
jgi:hypothetical protein